MSVDYWCRCRDCQYCDLSEHKGYKKYCTWYGIYVDADEVQECKRFRTDPFPETYSTSYETSHDSDTYQSSSESLSSSSYGIGYSSPSSYSQASSYSYSSSGGTGYGIVFIAVGLAMLGGFIHLLITDFAFTVCGFVLPIVTIITVIVLTLNSIDGLFLNGGKGLLPITIIFIIAKLVLRILVLIYYANWNNPIQLYLMGIILSVILFVTILVFFIVKKNQNYQSADAGKGILHKIATLSVFAAWILIGLGFVQIPAVEFIINNTVLFILTPFIPIIPGA